MRDAVICEPAAHPGRPLRRRVQGRRRRRAGRHRVARPGRAHRHHRRATSTTSSSASATPTARPRRSAGSPRSTPGCGVRRPRPAGRPALRLRAAGGASTPPCRCRPGRRPGHRRRRRVMSQAELYATGAALGRQGRRRRCCTTAWPAAGSPPAAATTRCPAACWRRPRTCAASTASPRRSRTRWRCARTSGPSRPQRAGRFADEIVPVDGDAAQGRQTVRRHRRAPARRHHAGDAGRSCARCCGRSRPRGDRHRRQRQRPERRRGGLHRHHAEKAPSLGLRPLARLVSLGRRRACRRDHGHRPGAGHRARR